jgi:hypothetical protein
MHVESRGRQEQRLEVWNALNMIPMKMGQKEVQRKILPSKLGGEMMP